MNRPVSGPFGPSGTEAVVKGGNLGEMRHFRKRSHVRAKCWKFDIPDELEQTALMVDQEAATAEGPSAHHGQFAVDLAEPIGLRGPAFKACARDRMACDPSRRRYQGRTPARSTAHGGHLCGAIGC